MQERLLFGVVPVYGLLITLAIALAVFLCTREEKRLGLPKDISIDLALWAVPSAVIGARLYYVAFQWPLYRDNPIRILYIWEGGLAIYGAVIGGALAALALAKIKKVPYAALADLVAPVLILGQAIGRWGNFVNGEAHGGPTTLPWGMTIDGQSMVHPTFLYESLWNLAGFVLLHFYSKKRRFKGEIALLYAAWYGAGRAWIEGLRTDSLYLFSTGIRVSQNNH